MTSTDATMAVIDALADLGIAYMLVGSYSSNYYGVARSTKDADFVVQLVGFRRQELAEKLGPAFKFDPQLSFETVTGSMRQIINVEGTPFRIELFGLKDDPYDQERFRRRRSIQMGERTIFLPTPEDVIVTKLRWTMLAKRNKDWDDVRNVIAVQGDDRLDWPYIYSWCDRHGTRATLDEIRRSIPPI